MLRFLLPIGAAAALGGCASVAAEPQRPPKAENPCHAESAQSFIGQKASSESGAAMLKASGATMLRWVPPRTAVTMIYIEGRLTVSYDDDYVITRVSCN